MKLIIYMECFVAKIAAKTKKAGEFYRMWKKWCVILDQVAAEKLEEYLSSEEQK